MIKWCNMGEMEHTAQIRTKGNAQGVVVSYNLGTIAIIFVVNILLFGLLFSMLSQTGQELPL